MRSFLEIPVTVEEKLWGTLNFIDSSEKPGVELGGIRHPQDARCLIGVAIARARYVKELADAKMIVQSSPTLIAERERFC